MIKKWDELSTEEKTDILVGISTTVPLSIGDSRLVSAIYDLLADTLSENASIMSEQVDNHSHQERYGTRYMCDILANMRKCHSTRNYSYLSGLIEEAQYRAERMENALETYGKEYNGIVKAETRRIELKKEIDELKKEKEELENGQKEKSV